MGNVFNPTNWILDTADTTKLVRETSTHLRIQRIEWQPSACGDTLLIKDRGGNTRISKTAIEASPAGDIIWDYRPNLMKIDGFILHTMTGGTLYVDLP